MTERLPVRCAIYTRKSSEEGLEQSFNSLDAQREACIAYITSQKQEGWQVIDTLYDDGGYSGGSMGRPALRELLTDIEAKKIDTVVVYKVDRLTRSLTDFAKIIETFDTHGVSFVSVTQHFNTTTSMGRLTLNVLLSFAQFEREVTGERIRDKIAASKKKGMWMGGYVPLGYDVKDRCLIVNESEATLVRFIYQRYLELGCVRKLKADLDEKGIKSKIRNGKTRKAMGGTSFSRGALYGVLRNRLYLGEITHRGKSYPGQHSAIVPTDIWDKTQLLLKSNRQAKQYGLRAREPSPLAGLLYDDRDNRLTPAHSVKNGKRYRYYVSQALIQHRTGNVGMARRIPAHDIEEVVRQRLQALLGSVGQFSGSVLLPTDDAITQKTLLSAAQRWSQTLARPESVTFKRFLQTTTSKIVVGVKSVEIHLVREGLRAALLDQVPTGEPMADGGDLVKLAVEVTLKRCGHEMRLILPATSDLERPIRMDPALIKAVARGYQWYTQLTTGEAPSLKALAAKTGVHKRYMSQIIRCALLAPDIVELILEGRQPPELTLDKLLKNVPMDWNEQRRSFGIAVCGQARS